MSPVSRIPVTIDAGQSLSPAVEVRFDELVGVGFPSAWTAAGLTFQVSVDGVTYRDLYSTSAEFAIASAAAGANRQVALNPLDMAGVRFLKVRSGTAGTPVVQAAARDLDLIVRGLWC